MSKSVRILMALGLAATVIGCGSGSRNTGPTGTVCEPNINPLPVEMDKTAQKVNLDPSAGDLKSFLGNYTYEGAQIFYKNSATGTQVLIAESRNVKDPTKLGFSRTCVSGIKPTLSFSVSLTGLASMNVEEDKNSVTGVKITQLQVRDYLLTYSNLTMVTKADFDKNAKFESPNKVYEGKISEYAFYKVAPKNDSAFQFRSKVTQGSETVYFVIRYKREMPGASLTNMDARDLNLRNLNSR